MVDLKDLHGDDIDDDYVDFLHGKLDAVEKELDAANFRFTRMQKQQQEVHDGSKNKLKTMEEQSERWKTKAKEEFDKFRNVQEMNHQMNVEIAALNQSWRKTKAERHAFKKSWESEKHTTEKLRRKVQFYLNRLTSQESRAQSPKESKQNREITTSHTLTQDTRIHEQLYEELNACLIQTQPCPMVTSSPKPLGCSNSISIQTDSMESSTFNDLKSLELEKVKYKAQALKAVIEEYRMKASENEAARENALREVGSLRQEKETVVSQLQAVKEQLTQKSMCNDEVSTEVGWLERKLKEEVEASGVLKEELVIRDDLIKEMTNELVEMKACSESSEMRTEKLNEEVMIWKGKLASLQEWKKKVTQQVTDWKNVIFKLTVEGPNTTELSLQETLESLQQNHISFAENIEANLL